MGSQLHRCVKPFSTLLLPLSKNLSFRTRATGKTARIADGFVVLDQAKVLFTVTCASSTFQPFCRTKSSYLSSTLLLPLSKNLSFRTGATGNSRDCTFARFMKQNRLGLRKLSPAGEGGEGVAVAEEQPQEIVFVPVSLSDMLTMFFQADRTLNEAAIPNVTRALQFGVSNEKANTSRSITLMCSAKGWSLTTMATHSVSTFSFRPSKGDLSHKLQRCSGRQVSFVKKTVMEICGNVDIDSLLCQYMTTNIDSKSVCIVVCFGGVNHRRYIMTFQSFKNSKSFLVSVAPMATQGRPQLGCLAKLHVVAGFEEFTHISCRLLHQELFIR
ncbi:PREDICTED: uncharacterized protein LOC104737934 [Camelina sativa]|uniref:Uncharacterized protein LOC104737934 n=1 Tax=Camelina sativa TaxID=90675 RepID=A0ABM0VI19_CAMSA|nr:PREDICTED: uncharacterized protein LOC104737934 [Camelina sativa]